MNSLAKNNGALRNHARVLSANVALVTIAATISPLLLVAEAAADCRRPNGRFVADAGAICSSDVNQVVPTNQGSVAVEINRESQAEFTAPSLAVEAVRNGDFGIRLRNNSAMTTAGDLTVNFQSTSADGNAAAIVSGSGSTININGNLNVNSTLYGIRAIQGSTLTVLGNASIESAKDAVSVRHEGTVTALRGETIDIVTSGNGARGLFAEDGGKIVVARDALAVPTDTNSTIIVDNSNLRITTNGNNANGIQSRADSGDAIVNIKGAKVTTLGDNSEAIYAFVPMRDGNAIAVVEDVTIRTSGENSDGVVASLSNGRIDLTQMPGSASVEMRSGSIVTEGNGSAGLIAQTDLNIGGSTPGNASVRMLDGSITTNGTGAGLWGLDGSHGIFAGATGTGDSDVTQLAGSITTNGASAHGIYSLSYKGIASVATGEKSTVIANGDGADAIRATAFEGERFGVFVGGTVRGGTGTGAGIATNGLRGTIDIAAGATVSAGSGVAIRNQGASFTLPFPPVEIGDIRNSTVAIRTAGIIDGDILTVDGADSLQFLGASRTNGNILTAAGDDQLSFETGSQFTGNIDTGLGDDLLLVSGAIAGNIQMGAGSDRLVVTAGADIGGVTAIDGGDDRLSSDGMIDRIIFDGGKHALDATRLINWEMVALANAAGLDLSGGALATGSGSYDGEALGLSLSAGSLINVIEPSFTLTGDVANAGTISLGNGRTGDVFTIAADPSVTGPSGQYNGLGGYFVLDTVLAGSDSPTDRLVLDGGAAFGTSGLLVNNLGGRGPAPLGNGILVVDAVNGATTTQDSFYLAAPLGAGVYDYYLYRGGIDGTGTDNWYLRAADLPRPEVIGHLQIPSLAAETGLAHLGTYHQRTGGAGVTGAFDPDRQAYWSRTFGNRVDFTNAASSATAGEGDVNFSGNIIGTQAGVDLFEFEPSDAQIARLGVFASFSRSSGKVGGDLLTSGIAASNLKLNATSIGGYYTHNWANGTYLDLVGLYGWFDATTSSSRNISSNVDGRFGLVSAELGGAYRFANDWTLKPQAQLIWQSVNFEDSSDRFATIRYDNQANVLGRIGARLEKHDAQSHVTYFTSLDLWHRFGNTKGNVHFDNDSFGYSTEKTTVKAAVGASYKFDDKISGFAEVNYEHDIGGSGSNSLGGQVGLRIKF